MSTQIESSGGIARRLASRRSLRRGLLGLGILITAVALFYTEENWRGKRAWEKFKRESESRGEVLDWAALIPPAVPDDQNIFKAPRMQEWFVGRGENELSRKLGSIYGSLPQSKAKPVVVAEITIVTDETGPGTENADLIVKFDDPTARAQLDEFIRGRVGAAANGGAGYTFVTKSLDQFKPAHILVHADHMPTVGEVMAFHPECALVGSVPAGTRGTKLRIESVAGNVYGILLDPCPVTATDYLAASDAAESDFDVIREALKRPYARMEGDYQMPYAMPIPNFICLRAVAQILSQRTQCQLLLGQPDKALSDLTLLHDLSPIMLAPPTGKPMTLVAAMINVAITGLYAETVADGFRWHSWQEPQLIAIQQQLSRVNLPPLLAASLRDERTAESYQLLTMKPSELAKFHFGRSPTNFWQDIKDPEYLFLAFAPRGWIFQNLVVSGKLNQRTLDGFDPANSLVTPKVFMGVMDQASTMAKHFSPSTFLAMLFFPNYSRAMQTVAHNQAMVNEAMIACALELHRLAHGQYPQSLEEIVPQYMEKVPHDIIGGQPLKYRTTNGGAGFLLYSVGWNETDDDGTPGVKQDGSPALDSGDWVWLDGEPR